MPDRSFLRDDLSALTGKLTSAGPLSNANDIQKKEIFVVFSVDEQEIRRKIIQLDGVFIKPSPDLVVEITLL